MVLSLGPLSTVPVHCSGFFCLLLCSHLYRGRVLAPSTNALGGNVRNVRLNQAVVVTATGAFGLVDHIGPEAIGVRYLDQDGRQYAYVTHTTEELEASD